MHCMTWCLYIHIQKLKRRQAALAKTTALSPAQKDKWSVVLKAELMSSEESEADENGPVFVVRPLIWQADKVSEFLMNLDRKYTKHQSRKSSQMTVKRNKGVPSDREKPTQGVPEWALK